MTKEATSQPDAGSLISTGPLPTVQGLLPFPEKPGRGPDKALGPGGRVSPVLAVPALPAPRPATTLL